MFDSLSNVIFILIALAVFIGRTILQARKKPEPEPRIPVHFEDEKAEQKGVAAYAQTRGASAYIKNRAAKLPKKNPALKPAPAGGETQVPAAASPSPSAKPAGAGNGALAPARQGIFAIDRLSPLQQAVVMAEIIGPPKGLS